jgi:hypothetical protein
MDAIVVRSMLKWPDVPDVYGWLRLDRRGAWRIRVPADGGNFQPVGNVALTEFIGRNYEADSRGCWFFQNGPQRVFVGLDYAPFVFRLEGQSIIDQRGTRPSRVDGAWLDEEGSLILLSGDHLGLLDDRDLLSIADDLASERFAFGPHRLPVQKIKRTHLEGRFKFVKEPAPASQ